MSSVRSILATILPAAVAFAVPDLRALAALVAGLAVALPGGEE